MMKRGGLIAISIFAATGCASLSFERPERKAVIPGIAVERRNCDSPLGPIADGGSAKGYLNPTEKAGRHCQEGRLTCHDGIWDGEYVYLECINGDGAVSR